jgi:hypothetical protein
MEDCIMAINRFFDKIDEEDWAIRDDALLHSGFNKKELNALDDAAIIQLYECLTTEEKLNHAYRYAQGKEARDEEERQRSIREHAQWLRESYDREDDEAAHKARVGETTEQTEQRMLEIEDEYQEYMKGINK